LQYFFNEKTRKWFARLDPLVQGALLRTQEKIENLVLSSFPGANAKSGIRSPGYNKEIGGKIDSLHLYGCARDYSLASGFPMKIEGLVVLVEKDHYHVQIA